MIGRTRLNVLGAILALPFILWCGSQAFGFGIGFDSPPPAHLIGPPTKGQITYNVSYTGTTTATITFAGKCKNQTVNMGAVDVSTSTDGAGFLVADGTAVESWVEGVTLDISSFPQVNAFVPCYGNNVQGVHVSSVNKTVSKVSTGPTSAVWVGDVTIQGFK